MRSVVLDSSCLIAAVCAWHEHHDLTCRALEKAVDRRDRMLMAGHAVSEAYSVLTRLPHPHRLAPADAATVLTANWGSCRTVAATHRDYWRLLRRAGADGIAGGLFYDALIALCAVKAKAQELWTWNVHHFRRLDTGGVVVLSPAAVVG
jgi:predicted nucleic acid-binding protein